MKKNKEFMRTYKKQDLFFVLQIGVVFGALLITSIASIFNGFPIFSLFAMILFLLYIELIEINRENTKQRLVLEYGMKGWRK